MRCFGGFLSGRLHANVILPPANTCRRPAILGSVVACHPQAKSLPREGPACPCGAGGDNAPPAQHLDLLTNFHPTGLTGFLCPRSSSSLVLLLCGGALPSCLAWRRCRRSLPSRSVDSYYRPQPCDPPRQRHRGIPASPCLSARRPRRRRRRRHLSHLPTEANPSVASTCM